ncbi:hypothetical protein C8R47DRAFT_604502 [Mycena vitilis]|nr:hypothetical protein C8R47DRAFT_604502 [Mycena vitilis]
MYPHHAVPLTDSHVVSRSFVSTTMTANSVLQLQELCDHIAGFLQDSKWDLRACSVISPTFTSSAQRNLFREIICNRGTLDIDNISMMGRYDEPRAAMRLSAVLAASPHLIPYIRRMRLSLEGGVLKPLSQFDFPNLYDLVFHRRRGGAANDETIALAAQLIGTPSITRVGLIAPIFDNIHGMGRLFEKNTPALQTIYLHQVEVTNGSMEGESISMSRPKIKTLQWAWQWQSDPDYVLDPLCPFDLSALTNLTFGTRLSPPFTKLIQKTRRTLTHLTVDAQDLVGEDTSDRQPLFLAHLPALTHLTMLCNGHQLADAETLLGGLPPQHPLESLELQIKKVRKLNEEQMRPIAAACASLHDACVVTVWVRRFMSSADDTDNGALVRTAFAGSEKGGRLRVVV